MKTKLTCLAMLVALLAVACSKESASPSSSNKRFSVSINPMDEENKTVCDETGSVTWENNDAIMYFLKDGGSLYKSNVLVSEKEISVDVEIGSSPSYLMTVYGAKSISDRTAGSFKLTEAVKATQNGKFSDAHVAVAKCDNPKTETALVFNNITSIISFKLTSGEISKVIFKSNNGEILNAGGPILVSTSDGKNFSASFPSGNSSSEIAVNIKGAATYYIGTLPQTLANGFTIDCYIGEEKVATITSSKVTNLASNGLLNLGVLDERMIKTYNNLSDGGTANCYIVPKAGYWKFKADVKGNSTESLGGTPAKASVVWETFGTTNKPSEGDIVHDVKYESGNILFTSTGRNGNALIAVKDAADKILWSWHIWACEGFDPSVSAQMYRNNVGPIMDRNLGATSAKPGDVETFGLMYEWGRKDPFVGKGRINIATRAVTTAEWKIELASPTTGTVGYTIEHPDVYLVTDTTAMWDWHYNERDNTLWGTAKTKYDPCPAGWRAPDGGVNGVWSTARENPLEMKFKGYDSAKDGYDLTDLLGASSSCWYPANGCIWKESGKVSNNPWGMISSCTSNFSSSFGYNRVLYLVKDIISDVHNTAARSTACAIRCLSEKAAPIVVPDSVAINKTSIRLTVGGTAQLTAKVLPSNVNCSKITWYSSNESVVTVSDSGEISAVSSGTAYIYAYAHNKIYRRCKVSVGASYEPSINNYTPETFVW